MYTNIAKNIHLIPELNVRSMNTNFINLEVFIESLTVKLMLISVETSNLECYQYNQLEGYNICYNDSKINKADVVLMYIRKGIMKRQ